ncbi:unnamed protein product [Dibothriocephalus latus]|uniref:Uncharacterized protein n=1 Tax=Dibothriocephalus latus TaxID=60516 RepID=A0A3P7NXL6_DIBLA|nr:unnamed protein product [Dibothriocephalus latus]
MASMSNEESCNEGQEDIFLNQKRSAAVDMTCAVSNLYNTKIKSFGSRLVDQICTRQPCDATEFMNSLGKGKTKLGKFFPYDIEFKYWYIDH